MSSETKLSGFENIRGRECDSVDNPDTNNLAKTDHAALGVRCKVNVDMEEKKKRKKKKTKKSLTFISYDC